MGDINLCAARKQSRQFNSELLSVMYVTGKKINLKGERSWRDDVVHDHMYQNKIQGPSLTKVSTEARLVAFFVSVQSSDQLSLNQLRKP